MHVPSKAFGEFVEHDSGTPSISADELNAMIRKGTDIKVLDSRPFDEYARISIPTGINVPGAELVLRVRDIAPSPDTTIVVNCAGRTRSIIGAQSLINAGVPNKVVALRNGTMGWHLAGLTCDSGKIARAPAVSSSRVSSGADLVYCNRGGFALLHVCEQLTGFGWRGDRHPARHSSLPVVRAPAQAQISMRRN